MNRHLLLLGLLGCAGSPLTPPEMVPSREVAAIPIELPSVKNFRSNALLLKIAVPRGGRFLVDGAPLSDDALIERVHAALRADPNSWIVIAADKDGAFDRVVRAMDLIRQSGGERIAFAVTPVGAATKPRAIGSDWNCPFPPEADKPEIDEAKVSVRVTVASSGDVENVEVLEDPGHGFGAAAARCAAQQKFQPGRDSSQRPVQAQVTVVVHFLR